MGSIGQCTAGSKNIRVSQGDQRSNRVQSLTTSWSPVKTDSHPEGDGSSGKAKQVCNNISPVFKGSLASVENRV
jgi:hypothetical protein